MAEEQKCPAWAPDEASSARIAFASACHANFQNMVTVADSKAAALIAIQGLVVSLLGSNMVDRVAEGIRIPNALGVSLGAVVSITLLLTIASLLSALGVLYPRTDISGAVPPPSSAAFPMWLDNIQSQFHGNADEYSAGLQKAGPQDVIGAWTYENLKIGWLLKKKFWWLKGSLFLLIFASVGWALTLTLAVHVAMPACK